MRILLVNADDAGLNAATDRAILRCVREGIVRNASVVAGGPTAAGFVEEAVRLGLDLGLHINLTEGAAVAGRASTLTDSRGRFRGPKQEVWRRAAANALDPDEVHTEVLAQWNWLADRGVRPSHVDGHNHVHVFPAARRALATLGRDVWVRIPQDHDRAAAARPDLPETLAPWAEALRPRCPAVEHFTGFEFSREPTVDRFLRSLTDAPATLEFMVHPGKRPGSGFSSSVFRDLEVQTLCSPALAMQLVMSGWHPAAFRDLSCASPS